MLDDQMLCSTLAREADEPLIGTAVRNDFHIVIALPRREWDARAENMDNDAGELARLIKPLDGQVILSLKHCEPEESGTIWLLPHAYRFDGLHREDYPALLKAVLNGEISIPHTHIKGEKFILVCTHGKRDRCCAKRGGAAVDALRELAPEQFNIWEISHLGGHRLSATMVVHPGSYWYGRIDPEDAPDLIAAIRANRVLTSRYRGNASFPPPLQAAECWGWEQLHMQNLKGEVHLVNPLVEGNRAEVTVSLEKRRHHPGDTLLQKTTLYLEADSYTFQANCTDESRSEREIWHIREVKHHKPNWIR